ncbi:MAG TPA: hypothetical protein VFO44_11165, partial [Steroidobacteraceae bacterium]|nr:hypothetical protein [Steroidobacteraceae bacterium]
ETELDHFQQEKVRIRKELRAVRAGLDEDIGHLGTVVKVLDIVVFPALFVLIAVLIGLWRRQRRLGARPAAAPAQAPKEARP